MALGVALVTLVQPDTPWFGFSREASENIRATNLLVAVWLLVFSIPLMVWVKEDRSHVSKAGQILADTAVQLAGTFSEIRQYRQIVRFLLARLVFNDGLVTIFAFGGIYAAETFGFSLEEVLIFGIVLNVAAGSGALLMGYLDDWIGGKRTIVLSLIGLIVATLLAVFATSRLWFWGRRHYHRYFRRTESGCKPLPHGSLRASAVRERVLRILRIFRQAHSLHGSAVARCADSVDRLAAGWRSCRAGIFRRWTCVDADGR